MPQHSGVQELQVCVRLINKLVQRYFQSPWLYSNISSFFEGDLIDSTLYSAVSISLPHKSLWNI